MTDKIDKDDWEFWYYNRVHEFSEKLLAPMYKQLNEPTINDIIKNEQESNHE
jgi:hypothetical protein